MMRTITRRRLRGFRLLASGRTWDHTIWALQDRLTRPRIAWSSGLKTLRASVGLKIFWFRMCCAGQMPPVRGLTIDERRADSLGGGLPAARHAEPDHPSVSRPYAQGSASGRRSRGCDERPSPWCDYARVDLARSRDAPAAATRRAPPREIARVEATRREPQMRRGRPRRERVGQLTRLCTRMRRIDIDACYRPRGCRACHARGN